jgi:inositol transport system ATP-binding protein
MNQPWLLKAENISKSFPGVKALDKVNLTIEGGKVHTIIGENGAGKSTLMKILMGILLPDEGEILYKGVKVKLMSVQEAIKTGISMIHQELLPFPELSIAENIFMGNEPTSRIPGWINKREMNKNAALLMDKLGAKVDVTRAMKELSIAEMQMVEIAKAISNQSEVIIMDEPTSALSNREIAILFSIIEELKQQGIAIIYISHKMDEIFKISDTITVMRDGKHITTCAINAIDQKKLISLIVGREINSIFDKKENTPGEVILSVTELTGEKFKDINFSLRRGEILGIAGLMGSGRTEIVNSIYGLEKIVKGDIFINGKKVKIRSPKDAIKNSIGLVSEDRKKYGLVLGSSVKHNISLSSLEKCKNGLFLNLKEENEIANAQINKLNIKTSSSDQLANYLSGGNQQKIVIAKVLLNDADIIIFDEPTRGIDIGAKSEIYKLMTQLATEGKALIVISSELPEILGLSDRILVIREGEIKAELSQAEATQELIMKHAMA